ncbi:MULTISPECIES: RNA polymerase sigma-70 factor [Sphingobacterium]|uniref:RNA polymerase sigma factor n=1 Tax=Sphingobacterium ginsenosidimutans TaxID=687845 RepID=A0ABP8A6Q8_9SPHI|nr:RNA polymerase sigma-70 factor [Sphingobacterium sp. E70]ULT25287.1 RNA polymerase sigma-70 factor [Sphingobacterium sp. E70]
MESLDKDRELLLAISTGDEKAFGRLYEIYYAKLIVFLKKFTYEDPSKAEDILQEAFLRVWLYRDRILEIDNFQAWLYKVVSMESLTFLRKEVHAKNKVSRLKLQYDQELLSTIHLPRAMEFDEIKKIVYQTVASMPDQRRKIYLLSREEHLNSKEIASQLAISTSTVHNTISTALKQIRQALSDQGYPVSFGILLLLKIF